MDTAVPASPPPTRRGSPLGRPVSRVDGGAKVTGAADYAAEHFPEGVVHAVIVQSTIAAGRVRRIDASGAEALPGVLAVLTHANAPRIVKAARFPMGGTAQSFTPLQDDRVRFNGQHIAVVVADTLERAMDGARRVRVDYDEGPAVKEPLGAVGGGEPLDPKQLGGQASEAAWGDPHGALAAAPVRVDAVYTTPREYQCPIEPHATVAQWHDDGSLTVWEPSQWVEGARKAFSDWFSLPYEKVRVISPYVGGGFGSKAVVQPHAALAAMAARAVGRPVKLVLLRPQTFTAAGGRPATRQRVALGAGPDGTLQSLVYEGENETSTEDAYVEAGGGASRLFYAVPNLSTTNKVVPLNIMTPGWMRAPGEAVGTFALECAMDELAHALGMDPVGLRRRNWAGEDQEAKKPWSTRRLPEAFDAGAKAFGWERRNPEPRSMRDGRRLIGRGVASGTYPVFATPAEARVRVLADGSVEVESGGADIGTGTYTILAQVAADVLGVPVERVRVRLGDTTLPRAPVAGGSQLANLLAGAVHKTAAAAREELFAIAAGDPASPLRAARANDFTLADGRVALASDPARGVPVPELLRAAGRAAVEANGDTLPPGANAEEDRRATFGTVTRMRTAASGTHSMRSWSAQFVEVAVDEDFGTVRVRRMVGAFDCGRLYNPKLAESQLMGGMVMGLGQALLEAAHVDRRHARIVNNNIAEYLVPVNADVPDIRVISVGEPDTLASPLGGKAVGELGITGVAGAIANAVFHATGKRVRDLPISIEKLL